MDSRARLLTDLVERHYALLYRYAYRLSGTVSDAEDLTQQTFLTAHQKWEQLRDERCAKSWLFTILRNAYLKQRRGPATLPAGLLDDVPESPQHVDPPDLDSEQLQNLLDELPEEFRSPLVLFYFEEFSYKEIAEHMGTPIGTVMSRLARAKSWLRGRLAVPVGAPQPSAASAR